MTASSWTAFFFATSAEARGLKKHFQLRSRILFKKHRIFCGHLRQGPETPVLIVETGMGPSAAAEAARFVFEHFPISEAWILGMAGASQAGLKPGQALLATRIGSPEIPPEGWKLPAPHLVQRAKALLENEKTPPLEGPILTVDHVVNSPEEKGRLGEPYQALGLEMEGTPIAQKAQEKGVPWVMIRWVLDPLEYPLPSMETWVDGQGRIKPREALKAMFKNPSLLLQMPAFLGKVRKGFQGMNHFLRKWIENGNMAPSKKFVGGTGEVSSTLK